MNKIYVLGMGPGNKEYILPITTRIIEGCDVLIGGKRNLQYYEDLGKEILYIQSDLAGIMDYVEKNRSNKKIAFLLSGDTGFYSMLDYIKKHIKTSELEVIPGISSFQYLMAQIGEPWQTAYVGSLHGRTCDFIEIIQQYEKAIFLTDHKYSPQQIAKELLQHKIGNKRMIVGENLSYENERIIMGKPEEIVDIPKFDMAVVVIMNDK
ncbi:cobalt-precorrin-7 (C5)-methyltransferase [Anaerosolibacter carboniphilus]|uniref:Cobalt-precorrin-7 (C5)-methyltransferase n=1 Tax=Anaerosolibacter carboniphilus TaxID=1417629 RepID=A0A841KWN5_9FIRM|nr:precorrin-6y C5,15-methyltransferase (decarboxylating) subunit CbiE [Anaerosolibacter carboniphilus]MBB6214599.1 cobalt-precorrin-7 (C5)-methyltransferase [Anaerosolibacter carboniphilus]